MVEQEVRLEIDGQVLDVNARLDVSEPLSDWASPMPNVILGWFLDQEKLWFLQMAQRNLGQMVFNEENTRYSFTFSRETQAFVAVRMNGREAQIVARVDAKARAIKEGTGEWGDAIMQEMRIAVPFETSQAELQFLETYVAWRRKNPL